jgi:hypothetical protein
MDGKTHGEQWRDVVVANDKKAKPPSIRDQHLVTYSELGVTGVLRWLALRDSFARALDPVISSIDLTAATPNTLLAHTGPGLEALGYLLLLRDGMAEKEANAANLRTRLDRILADVGDSLPFSGVRWADEVVRDYNGLKHANRTMPDAIDVLNSWRWSVLVVRAWVAIELGVPMDQVKTRLQDDRQSFRYISVR